MAAQFTLPAWIDRLSVEYAVKLMLYQFTGGTAPSGGGGGIPLTSGTANFFAKTAGQTETIPAGAWGISVIFLTGTGTIGGVDQPVGVPWSGGETRTAATIAVVCGSPGTARVFYWT